MSSASPSRTAVGTRKAPTRRRAFRYGSRPAPQVDIQHLEEDPHVAEAYETDAKDRELMERLVDNARIPVEVLAEDLELEPADVEQRIARLEQIGIIKAYRAVVDPYLYSLYFYEKGPLGLGATAGPRAARGARAPRR